MNYTESDSNRDDLASATWPGPLWVMGDYPHHPYPPVPQNIHPDSVSDPGYPSTSGTYVPGLNAANDAALTFAPTSEMGSLADLPTQLDFTNLVSDQCVGTSFLSRICYDPPYSLMRIEKLPST
jgi:hypothetical protein